MPSDSLLPLEGQVNEVMSLPRKEADAFGRILFVVAKAFAIIGGVVLVGIVSVSIVSIVGRKVAASPVPGDIEILQMCAAPAMACFFAYCHLLNGDVRVDILADQLGPKAQKALAALGSVLLGLVAALIAWRTGAGAAALFDAGETTALLSWPVWLSQALLVPGFVLQSIAGFYMAYRHLSGGGALAS